MRQEESVEQEHAEVIDLPKSKKSSKSVDEPQKKDNTVHDPYQDLDPDMAAALRRDDDEIKELEQKLGLAKNRKGKDKLNKEYARLEGYGDDFGDFLDGLDEMVRHVTKGNSDEVLRKEGKKNKKRRKSKIDDDSYNTFDPDIAAAMRRDDDEIKELEQKLGLKSKSQKSKLHKEYAKLEGFGGDFGEWLDDLDDMMVRVTAPLNSNDKPSKDLTTDNEDESDGESREDNMSEDNFSDGEELVPMKEPFEALDDDDSVLEELENDELNRDKDSDGERSVDDTSDSDEAEESDSDTEDHKSDTLDMESVSSDEESQNTFEAEPDHDIADTYRPTKGEDIYGKKIDSSGEGTEKPKKYIPPHLRKSQTDDADNKERLRLIQRALNNSMNKLSEDTLISVAQQVSQLFNSHPTQTVQEMIWKNTRDACVLPPMIMKGLIPVYVASIVGTHIQTGDTVQVGEYILEMVVTELWKELKEARKEKVSSENQADDEMEQKRICNLMLILSYLYNYGIVHCSLMYAVVRHLIENFSETDIESLLILLRHCGRSLRSDDPLALKEIVLLVQKKKSEESKMSSSSRAEYMLSAIMDLKNNRRRKQDDAYFERVGKLRKLLGRIKSSVQSTKNSESSLRISLQDILDAETKGRWWKVGASWVGNQYRFSEDGSDSTKAIPNGNKSIEDNRSQEDEELLKLASKYRMNTDRKRVIFCIIMGGVDCEDAFEKLCRGSMLQNRSERDTVRVLMECCGNEKSYNKYYGHLANRICEYQPQCKFSLQLAYWDAFKQFDSMDARKAANLAKLLFHLVATHQTLKLMTVIKALEIDEDMEEAGMIFLTILLSDIMEYYDDPNQAKAQFASSQGRKSKEDQVDQEEGFRASLLVFLLETLKASPKNKKGSKFRKNFKAVVKSLDTDGFENMF